MLRISIADSLRERIAQTSSLAIAAVLTVSALAPVLLSREAGAAQLTERKITLETSNVSAANTDYAVSFKTSAATVIRGVVVEICMNSPLVGDSCTITNGVTASPTTGTVTFTNTGSSGDATFEVHANSINTGRFIATDSDGATGGDGLTPAPANPLTFTITMTNPSAIGSFYARILTYSTAADAAAYDDTVPGSNIIDDGGVALSTARQLTVTGRVQERLEFCVFSIDDVDPLPVNCAAAPVTTTIQLGILDEASVATSPVDDTGTNGANDEYGAMMIKTNAAQGTAVTYYANTASSGSVELEGFRVNGATCIGAGSETDQCFNSAAGAGATLGTDFNLGDEIFGMHIVCIDDTDAGPASTTQSFRPANGGSVPAAYSNVDNDWHTTQTDCENADTGDKYAWNTTTTAVSLASVAAGNVIDDEIIKVRFGAMTAATTPAGTYSVQSTYIATATF